MAGKAPWQEIEAASDLATVIRKWRIDRRVGGDGENSRSTLRDTLQPARLHLKVCFQLETNWSNT